MKNKGNLSLPEGTKIPKHIAIIPDGNRRWAKAKGLPTFKGHKKGFEIAVTIAKAARDFGVHTFTIWAFSTENWLRAKEEVDYLMKMYEWFIDRHLKEALRDNVRIIHLGRKDRIPKPLAQKIIQTEEKTKNNTANVLNIALDYGGHDEILRATEKIFKALKEGKITLEDITKENGKYCDKYPYYLYKDYLDTKDQPYPYPDLLIRTSGEQRTSGLLCWQTAYSELYWEKDHFPDFTPEKLLDAIIDYSNRQRRFGGS